MATDKPRFSITLDYDTMDSVMEYKKTNNLSTQSKAIQRLIEIGLESIVSELGISPASSVSSDSLSPTERRLVSAWRQADDKDRRIVAATLSDYGFTYQEDSSVNAG